VKLQKQNARWKYIIIFNLKSSNKVSMEDILDQHLIEKDSPNKNKHHRTFSILVILQIIGSIVGVAFAWSEVESIIGSGPSLSVFGIIVFLFARLAQNKFGMVLGFIPLLASFISFCIIFFFSLSPNQAQFPISALLSFFLFISFLLGIFSLMKRN
jgi:hypothetical protein